MAKATKTKYPIVTPTLEGWAEVPENIWGDKTLTRLYINGNEAATLSCHHDNAFSLLKDQKNEYSFRLGYNLGEEKIRFFSKIDAMLAAEEMIEFLNKLAVKYKGRYPDTKPVKIKSKGKF